MPTVRLDHAARLGQPLLVLVGFHEIQQVGVTGELDQIRMGDGQGLRGLTGTIQGQSGTFRPQAKAKSHEILSKLGGAARI